jgi:hypothetical protein
MQPRQPAGCSVEGEVLCSTHDLAPKIGNSCNQILAATFAAHDHTAVTTVALDLDFKASRAAGDMARPVDDHTLFHHVVWAAMLAPWHKTELRRCWRRGYREQAARGETDPRWSSFNHKPL